MIEINEDNIESICAVTIALCFAEPMIQLLRHCKPYQSH